MIDCDVAPGTIDSGTVTDYTMHVLAQTDLILL
jgi:hypothetical protein